MPDTTTRAREIRAELDKLAPYPAEGPVKAQDFARYLAMEAQVMFARYMDASHDPSLTEVVSLQGFYAASCALMSWAEADVTRGEADECAQDIRDAFESGGAIPEWVYEHLGSDAERINDLARELAEIGAGVRAAAKGPWGPLTQDDLRVILTTKGPLPDGVYDRLAAAAGVTR